MTSSMRVSTFTRFVGWVSLAVFGGLGHLPCSCSEQERRAPETNRPSVSGRVVWPQNGPRKQNAHEGWSQVRVIVGCGGQICTDDLRVMSSGNPVFAHHHDTLKSYRKLKQDRDLPASPCSRFVTSYHLISQRCVNVRSTSGTDRLGYVGMTTMSTGRLPEPQPG